MKKKKKNSRKVVPIINVGEEFMTYTAAHHKGDIWDDSRSHVIQLCLHLVTEDMDRRGTTVRQYFFVTSLDTTTNCSHSSTLESIEKQNKTTKTMSRPTDYSVQTDRATALMVACYAW